MIDIFKQSWFFFTRNYLVIGIATTIFSFIGWWLVPDIMYQNIEVTEIRDIEDVMDEVDISRIALFFLVTEIFSLLFFTNLFRNIIMSPDMGTGRMLIYSFIGLGHASINLAISLLLVSAVAGILLIPLWFLSGPIVSFLQIIAAGLFVYISLKLAFLSQAAVHEDGIRPVVCLIKSFKLTENNLLQIFIVFCFMILATGIVGGIVGIADGRDIPNALFILIDSLLLYHIKVFSWLLIYRLFLNALHQSDAEQA